MEGKTIDSGGKKDDPAESFASLTPPTPNRSWHSAAPSGPSSHDRGAARIAARHAPVTRSMQRPLVVQKQPLEGRKDLALLPHSRPSPCPQIEQRRVRARRAVEGVHAASTPDAGANARIQPAL